MSVAPDPADYQADRLPDEPKKAPNAAFKRLTRATSEAASESNNPIINAFLGILYSIAAISFVFRILKLVVTFRRRRAKHWPGMLFGAFVAALLAVIIVINCPKVLHWEIGLLSTAAFLGIYAIYQHTPRIDDVRRRRRQQAQDDFTSVSHQHKAQKPQDDFTSLTRRSKAGRR